MPYTCGFPDMPDDHGNGLCTSHIIIANQLQMTQTRSICIANETSMFDHFQTTHWGPSALAIDKVNHYSSPAMKHNPVSVAYVFASWENNYVNRHCLIYAYIHDI